MKNLLKKEFKFAAIISYIFIIFSFMTLIPNYPILVGAFFVCYGIFQTFQSCREANDTLYSAMLPVKKSDVVKARYMFVIIIQLISFVIMSVLTVLRIFLLNKTVMYSQNTMMNANLAFLGFALLIFASFNVFFVNGHYKTAYRIGIPFLIFGISCLVIIFLAEALHFIPGLYFLNLNFHYSHLIIFAVGLIVYIAGTLLSLKKSQKNFNTIDL